MTLAEVLVGLTVFAALVILCGMYLPSPSGPLHRSSSISYLNCMRQIHLATMAMANDGHDNKDRSIGWPGDLKADGQIQTLSDFVNLLVKNDYLKVGDLKLFAARGITAYQGALENGVLVPNFAEKYSGAKVYLVKDEQPGNTLFLATKNYTYNNILADPQAIPFGDKGFIVCRKGGDISMYRKDQARDIERIGQLPGGGTVEGPGNCLNP